MNNVNVDYYTLSLFITYLRLDDGRVRATDYAHALYGLILTLWAVSDLWLWGIFSCLLFKFSKIINFEFNWYFFNQASSSIILVIWYLD